MTSFLAKARIVTDLISLLSAAGDLAAKFPALAPALSSVAEDALSLATDLSFAAAEKLVGDARKAFEDFCAAYSRDDASVQAFIDALHQLVANARN